MLTAAEFRAALPPVAAAWAATAPPGTPRWRVDAMSDATPFAAALGGATLVLVGGDGVDGVPVDVSGEADGGGVIIAGPGEQPDAAALPPPPPRLHAHAVYAPCHAAPSLLVRCVDGAGAALPLADVDAALPAAAARAGAPLPPPPVAPADHPASCSGGGWGALHPCGGGQLAGEVVAGKGGNLPPPAVRLAAWLSFAAPAVGVRVPLAFAGAVEKDL